MDEALAPAPAAAPAPRAEPVDYDREEKRLSAMLSEEQKAVFMEKYESSSDDQKALIDSDQEVRVGLLKGITDGLNKDASGPFKYFNTEKKIQSSASDAVKSIMDGWRSGIKDNLPLKKGSPSAVSRELQPTGKTPGVNAGRGESSLMNKHRGTRFE